MKKSSFVAMVLGTVSGVLFALGMCMALLPEWDAFKPGVIMGAVGIALGIVTYLIWRKMEGKAPIRLSVKSIIVIVVSSVGALSLGIGMCFCIVWNKMVLGIIIGLFGMLVLMSLIPLIKGIK